MIVIAILFAVFLIGIAILADTGHLGVLRFIYEIPHGDKLGHFVLYGILSFLLNLTILRARPVSTSKRVAVSTTLLLALVIGLEEFLQRFFATRTSDWMDLLSSYSGVALGAWLVHKKR
jgi:VanZ family protein